MRTAEFHLLSWLHLKRSSSRISARLRDTWAPLFWPTWPGAVDWTLLIDERSFSWLKIQNSRWTRQQGSCSALAPHWLSNNQGFVIKNPYNADHCQTERIRGCVVIFTRMLSTKTRNIKLMSQSIWKLKFLKHSVLLNSTMSLISKEETRGFERVKNEPCGVQIISDFNEAFGLICFTFVTTFMHLRLNR